MVGIMLNKLHNVDARNLLKIIDEKVVDVTITSPPYFDMKDYGHKDQIGFGQKYPQYLNDLRDVFKSVFDVTKDTGSLWVIIDTFRKNNEVVPLPFDFSNKLKEVGWKLQDVIIWNKERTVPWSRKGHTKNKFEYILFFSKTSEFKYYVDKVREFDTRFLKKWWVRYPERYNPKGKSPEEIWNYDIPTQGSWGNGYVRHFCPLPTDMIGKIIDLSSDEGDVILDPFAGTGSVLVQASCMNRNFVGTELNKEYIKMFRNYYKKTLGKGIKSYNAIKSGKFTQEEFTKTILELRALKFPKVLKNKLPKQYQDFIQSIYVEESNKKVTQDYKLLRINYSILLKDDKVCKEITCLIDKIISKPPLSKFGIQPEISFVIPPEKRIEITKKSYVYSEKITHMFQGVFNPKKEYHSFIIISPIKVNIDENEFE